ncbi:hypothetical protein N6H14_08575 [Paenibacillus sp. CC-CFT747]|nr:hypothetical protein N6H14_08575 [Paenibacillus sp. CC-CFT747]
MKTYFWRGGGIPGLAAGLILGCFFKGIQAWSGEPVYVILLTIDYLPMVGGADLPEGAAFLLHLLISCLAAWVIHRIILRRRWTGKRRWAAVTGAGIGIGVLLYPTSFLSAYTPHDFDAGFLTWWLAGHLLYGITLGLMGTGIHPRASAERLP